MSIEPVTCYEAVCNECGADLADTLWPDDDPAPIHAGVQSAPVREGQK